MDQLRPKVIGRALCGTGAGKSRIRMGFGTNRSDYGSGSALGGATHVGLN